MKRNKKTIIIGIISVAAIVLLWLLFTGKFTKKKIEFDTEEVEKGQIVSTVVATGKLQAVISVEVGSQVSGKIQKLFVDFNSLVKEGQSLAQIDPSLFQAQVDEASASLESSRATLLNFQAQYDNALMKIKSAQAAVKSSEAQSSIAKAKLNNASYAEVSAKANVEKGKAQMQNNLAELKRAQELLKKNFISQSETDAAETKYKVSQSEVESAKAMLDQAISSVKSAKLELDSANYNLESSKIQEESQKALARSSKAQINQSLAQVHQSEGKLKQANVNLGYTIIRSPINGIVISRNIDAGQTVAASFQAPKLFQIAKDLKNMEVYADVAEADIGKVKKGQDVTFTVDAFRGEKFKGSVKQVRSAAKEDQNVVTYQVIISADNPDMKLKPGMTANVSITSEVKEDCIKVPNVALRFRADSIENFPFPKDKKEHSNGNDKNGKRKEKNSEEIENSGTVWVFEKAGHLHQEKVVLGITDGKYTEMKKGKLLQGEKLITGQAGKAKKNGSKRSSSIHIR